MRWQLGTGICVLAALTAAPGLAQDFTAEDQAPTGRFLTATEVRPILGATKPSWVAVRDWNGQDLVYFTQILSWRCGLHRIDYAINDGPFQALEMEPCYLDSAQPAALKADTILPYIIRPAGSVQSVSVRLLYDDMGEEEAQFTRAQVLMP